ncbi:ABC transporter substrate-binding protein [bacterium]|nr:ABC transporter substrate-binding protein [bacterium]
MIGTRLADRYEIQSELGRGGMGVVYLAYDPLLDRPIAVKLLTPGTFNAEAQERLKREARTIAKMDHHGVVGIYDVGTHQDSLFFVMPYVRGDNLRKLMKEKKLTLSDVLDLIIQTADALEYSHSLGIIHRDIKPENIMVTRSEDGHFHARITDFGLAIGSTDQRITESGLIVGTIAYLSPEQIAHQKVDQRSDVYSLATVLYECLTGRVPFTGELHLLLYSILHDTPQSPGELGIAMDPELETVLMHALEKDPALRPQRCKDFAQTLRRHRARLLEEEGISSDRAATPILTQQAKQPSLLIGREKEFNQLQRHLNTALTGECQFVVFGGEAGIGKTRLLEQLDRLAKAKRIRVLHGRFVEQDRVFPYQGFCEVIQEFFRVNTPQTSIPVDLSDLAADLISLFPVLGEIAEMKSTSTSTLARPMETKKVEDRIQIYELLAKTIARIGAGQPLLLFLEELHSADISLDALQYIVRRLGPTPTFIVGTYRSTEVQKGHALTRMLETFQGDRRFSTFSLQPFDREEHRAFLEVLIGSEKFETQFAERLYQATEGNPYFTKELIRSLMDAGQMIQTPDGGWALSADTAISSQALPVTIQQTIEKRIERLPADLRNILSLASVLGRSFDLLDLESMMETDEWTEEAMEKLINLGFLEEQNLSRGERFSFSSGVLRDVLYGALLRRQRRALNLRFANALEKKYARKLDRVYPRLLHHFVEADISEKVVEYGLKLAKKSLETFSGEEALRSARIALEFLEEEEEDSLIEAETRKMLASAIRLTGNFDGALKEFAKAADIYQKRNQGNEMLDIILLAAETAWEGRSIEATIQWIEIGLDLSRRIEMQDCRIKLLSLATTVANLRGEYQKAKEYLNEINSLQPAVQEKDEQVTTGGTLLVAFPASIQVRHPAQMTFDEEQEVLTNVFETLLTRDARGNLIPHLCERWEILNSGQTFLITLRSNIPMHDGQNLCPKDVKRSFEQAVRLCSEHLAAAFSAIRGVPEYLSGTAAEVSGITVLSENQIELQLNQSLPMYGSMLTDARTAIVKEVIDEFKGESPSLIKGGARGGLSEHLQPPPNLHLHEGEESLRQSPLYVGSGPFEMQSFRSNEIVLRRNPHYWKGATTLLDKIEFKTGIGSAATAAGFRKGSYDLARDLLPNDLEEILRTRYLKTQLVEVPKKNTYFVLFNQNSLALSDLRIRQGLASVVRTHDLIRRALGRFAQPAEGLLPPGILGHDPGRRKRPISREESLDFLKQAGVDSAVTLRASVHPSLQDRYCSLTKSLLQIWREIGVEVKIETPTIVEYQDRITNNAETDLMIGRWASDYDDPDNFIYGLFHSDAGRFRKYFCSQELDELISNARKEMHPAMRERLYLKIENLLHDSAMLIPLFHDVDYRLANPKIHALKLYSNPPYLNYSEIWKSESTATQVALSRRGGTIHVPASQEMNSLDPSLVFRLIEYEVLPTIFETLTRVTKGLHVATSLASECLAEAGGKRYRFRLRDDVRFHDGRKLTARDVRYSFERLLQNPASENRWLLSCISGAQELLKSEVGDLKGFRILSASEFVIELDQPLSFFPTLLTHPLTSIVPEGSEFFTGRPVGTGPFRVVNFDPGRRLELEANPDYWSKGYPKSDRLIFTFGVSISEILAGFRSGQFSLAWNLFPSDVEALRQESGIQYKEIPRLSTYYFALNIHKGPFQDEQMRRELFESLDVESLVRKTVGRLGILADSFIPPGLIGYEKRLRRTPEASRQLVRETSVTCFLNSIYQGPYSGFADEFSKNMRERGFRMNLVDTKSEYHINQASTLAKADCNLTRWISDYPDADSFVFLLHTEKGFIGKLCGLPEIDQLIERGRTEFNTSIRHEIYQEIEEIVERKALLLPLFHEQSYCFAQPDVEDFEINLMYSPVVAYEKLWKVRK